MDPYWMNQGATPSRMNQGRPSRMNQGQPSGMNQGTDPDQRGTGNDESLEENSPQQQAT